MGTIATKFSGDPAELLAAYEKVYSANVKMQQQLANLGQQSSKQHNDVVAHISRELTSLTNLAVGYLTIGKGVELVTKAYAAWYERMNAIGAKTLEVNRELTRQIVLSGQAANYAQIEESLKSIPGVKTADALTAYRGLQRGADYKVDQKRLLGLAGEVGRTASLGLQQPDIEALGAFAGELATFDKGTAPEKLVAQAMGIQSQAGRYFDKLQGAKIAGPIRTLVESGAMTNEQAWGLAIEATAQDAPGLMAKLAAASTSPYEKPQTKGRTRLTPEEAAKMKFATAAPGRERFDLLLNDAEVAKAVLPGEAATIGRLDRARAAALAANMAAGKGTPSDVRKNVMATPTGRQGVGQYTEEWEKLQLASIQAERAEDQRVAREMFAKSQENRGAWSAGMRQLQFSLPAVTDFVPGAWANPADWLDRVDPKLAQEFMEKRNRDAGYQRFDPKEANVTQEAILREQQKQTEVLLRIERARGGAQVNNVNER